MKRFQFSNCSSWRQVVTLLSITATAIFLIVTALFADSPDSIKKAGEDTPKPTITTPVKPNPVSLKALERLQANSSKKWRVHWHEKTGLPGIGSGEIRRKYKGTPEEIAMAFMEDYKGLFLGVADSQLLACYTFEAALTQKDQIGTSIKAQCKFKGVNIWKSHATVIFSVDGNIEAVYNYLKPIALDNVMPSLSIPEVEEIIRQAAAPDSVLLPSEFGEWFRNSGMPAPDMGAADPLELVIYPGSPPRLVYLGFRYVDYEPYRYTIDAHTGEILAQMFWGYRSQVREGDILKPDSRPPADSTVSPGPLQPEPIPVHRCPERHEGIIDSLMPLDTAGQSYYLQPRRGRRDEDNAPPLPPKEMPERPLLRTTSIEAHFYEYYILFEPGADGDGDGYYRSYYAQWDVDTWDDSALVEVVGVGWTEQGIEYDLFSPVAHQHGGFIFSLPAPMDLPENPP